jgi:F-type H+/Na+-transporting ATPase subunit alpha
VARVRVAEHGLVSQVSSSHPDILESIRTTRDLDDATAAKLRSAVDAYAKTFA